MDISNVNSMDQVMMMRQMQGGQRPRSMENMPMGQMDPSMKAHFSEAGKMMNSISQMSDSGKTEMKDFMQSVHKSIKDGDFDAEALAAEAPAEFQAIAEENGIDLEEHLNGMNEMHSKMQERRSSMMYNGQGMKMGGMAKDPNEMMMDALFGTEEEEDEYEYGYY